MMKFQRERASERASERDQVSGKVPLCRVTSAGRPCSSQMPGSVWWSLRMGGVLRDEGGLAAGVRLLLPLSGELAHIQGYLAHEKPPPS